MHGQFILWATYFSTYSRGISVPPALFCLHLLCQRLWTHFIPLVTLALGTLIPLTRYVAHTHPVTFEADGIPCGATNAAEYDSDSLPLSGGQFQS